MIRPATPADVDAWVALAVSMKEFYPGLDPAAHARAIEKCAASGEALTAEADGRFAGGLLFSRERRELSFLMVAPWARRRGRGRALVARMCEEFPRGETISVTTDRPGDPLGAAAGPFYAALGFLSDADVIAHGHPERTMTLFIPLETPGLSIRPFREEDFGAFLGLSDIPELPGWGARKPRPRAFFELLMADARKMDVREGGIWLALFEKSTGALVGVGRSGDLDETEVFCFTRPDFRRRGYAAQACGAVTDWALRRFSLPFIIGAAGVDNPASRRILEACGYRLADERVPQTRAKFAYYKKENA